MSSALAIINSTQLDSTQYKKFFIIRISSKKMNFPFKTITMKLNKINLGELKKIASLFSWLSKYCEDFLWCMKKQITKQIQKKKNWAWKEVKEDEKCKENKSLHFVERWWRWLKGYCSRYFFFFCSFKSLKLAIHKALTRRIYTFSILRSKSVSKEHEEFYWHRNRVENSVTAIEITFKNFFVIFFCAIFRKMKI